MQERFGKTTCRVLVTAGMWADQEGRETKLATHCFPSLGSAIDENKEAEDKGAMGIIGFRNALWLGGICSSEAFALCARKLEGSRGKAWVSFASQANNYLVSCLLWASLHRSI